MTTKKIDKTISEGKARVLGVESGTYSQDEQVFKAYRVNQDAIKQLQEKLNALKPMLKEIVEKHGGTFEHEGYLAQMIESKPSKIFKPKAEVLAIVPKRYHYSILKDMVKAPYVKVALAPKNNIVDITLKELV